MNASPSTSASGGGAPAAFTLTELLVIAVTGFILLGLAMPALANGRTRGASAVCVANARQMARAWQLYAADQHEQLVNNYGVDETLAEIYRATFRNWVNNVMSWTAANDVRSISVTNINWVNNGKLSPYLSDPIAPFRCPEDRYVSPQQRAKGWTARTRSISMNAFLGPFSPLPSDPSYRGENPFYSTYRQFIKTGDLSQPARTIVTLDEHADSINDGLLLNNPDPSSTQWSDLPASYHNGGGSLSFADAHVEIHRWQSSWTQPAVRYNYTTVTLDEASRVDYRWLMERMSGSR